jgi:hypothetical protein
VEASVRECAKEGWFELGKKASDPIELDALWGGKFPKTREHRDETWATTSASHTAGPPEVTSPVKFPIKTTNTAQYAAVAAKSSARFAFVKRPIEAVNTSEKPTRSPILRKVLQRLPYQVIRYMTNTGAASRRMITSATIRVASFSIRVTRK